MHLELVRAREELTETDGRCDGSRAELEEKRKSTTGGLLMLGRACVAGWFRTTAMSSGESEFYSATVCACEPLWACKCFKGFGIHHDCSVEGRRVCLHWHGNALGTWTIKHVESSFLHCNTGFDRDGSHSTR